MILNKNQIMKISPKQYAKLINEYTAGTQETSLLDEKVAQIAILIKRNRDQSKMDKIVSEYGKLAQKKSKQLVVQLESAQELGAELEERIKKQVSDKRGVKTDKIILISKVNPELIGGIMVKINNEVIDGSIKSKLARLKASLA